MTRITKKMQCHNKIEMSPSIFTQNLVFYRITPIKHLNSAI
jgi:hypothetical protein